MTDPPDKTRYLDGASVRAALPSQEELVDLAELALRSLVSGAQMPERAAVAPGPEGVFAGAMPARLRAAEVAGGGATSDLLGMKWIGGGTGNRARGLPALASLIVLDDPSTGAPVAIDGRRRDHGGAHGGAERRGRAAPRAAGRNERRAPGGPRRRRGPGSLPRCDARALLPGVRLAIHDRHPERADALAAHASGLSGVAEAVGAPDLAAVLRDADIVVTATSLSGRTSPASAIDPETWRRGPSSCPSTTRRSCRPAW